MRKVSKFLFTPVLVILLWCVSASPAQIVQAVKVASEGSESPFLVKRVDSPSILGQTVSLSLSGVTLKEALVEISKMTNVHFAYSEDDLPMHKMVSLHLAKATVADALNELLHGSRINWIPVNEEQVVLTRKEDVLQRTGSIKGKVTDESRAPIPFANVILKGTYLGSSADANGNYVITNIPGGTYTVQASAVGYRRKAAEVTVAEGETVTQDFTLAVDLLGMQEVVVTGTYIPLSKLRSTVAISTLTPRELTMSNTRSTTEMLRYIPGFTRIESSGGEVNENYTMRGILGVEYVMFMEDGMPVFPTMHTFFMNADNLFRVDENVERAEVVRSGSSSLFGSNTPGAIVNLINKTGGPELGGVVKATVGTGGLARYDLDVNGPIGKDWRFNLGGFYRYARGVRDPGFPGTRGGQIKTNITRLLDNGYIKLSAKYIDDRNQFILPLPFQNPGNPVYAPGFGNFGSMNTSEGLDLSVPTPSGSLQLPLSDGLRTKASWLTADVGFNFSNGWGFQNTAQIMWNEQGWNAIVPFNAMYADDWVYGPRNYGGLGFSRDYRYQLFFTNVLDASGKKVPFNTPNGLVAPGGEWHVEKPIHAFQDQLQLRKTIGEQQLSLGFYFANYTQTNKWFFTDILTDVRDNPHFLDLVVYTPSGDTVNYTQNGFRHFISYYVNGTGSTSIFSLSLGGNLKLTEQLRADVGFRYEFDSYQQNSENTSTQQVPVAPKTDPSVGSELWGNNTYRHFNRSMGDWAASIGLNYRVTDEMSVYAQASRGYKMPALDEFLNASAQAQVDLFEDRQVQDYEAGIKFSNPLFSLALDGFYTLLKNISGQGAIADTATGGVKWVILSSPQNISYGAELEASAKPLEGLSLMGNATILKSELGSGAGADIGSWIAGVPPIIGNLSCTYTFSGITFLADWHLVGRRYVDVRTNTILPTYSYFNFGLSYAIPGYGITISADLLNAFQSNGLEEGNPRLQQIPGGRTSDIFLARPILPRQLTASVTYRF